LTPRLTPASRPPGAVVQYRCPLAGFECGQVVTPERVRCEDCLAADPAQARRSAPSVLRRSRLANESSCSGARASLKADADEAWYRWEKLPRFAGHKVSEIVAATAYRNGHASTIRAGRWTPHMSPREAGESRRFSRFRRYTVADPVRVLIADDEALARSGLRLMFERQADVAVVGEATDGEQAVIQAALLRPDVVLMDIRMPGTDGLEATRRILEADADSEPRVHVIILTTFEQDEYVHEALRSGASGFLLKRTRPEDLLEAVRIVANGDALLAPSVTRRLLAHFANRPKSSLATPVELAQLTERERQVLVEMSKGLSNAAIGERLYVGEQTVKTHVKHIFTKLDLRDRAQAIVFAYENGLVRPGEG